MSSSVEGREFRQVSDLKVSHSFGCLCPFRSGETYVHVRTWGKTVDLRAGAGEVENNRVFAHQRGHLSCNPAHHSAAHHLRDHNMRKIFNQTHFLRFFYYFDKLNLQGKTWAVFFKWGKKCRYQRCVVAGSLFCIE